MVYCPSYQLFQSQDTIRQNRYFLCPHAWSSVYTNELNLKNTEQCIVTQMSALSCLQHVHWVSPYMWCWWLCSAPLQHDDCSSPGWRDSNPESSLLSTVEVLPVWDTSSAAADWYSFYQILWGNAERIPLLQQTCCMWVAQLWLCGAKL